MPSAESNSVAVTADAPGTYDCILDFGDNPALLGSGAATPQWFVPGRDKIVPAIDGSNWSGYALSYGQTLRVGVMECSMAESGVTCRSTRSGHWFSASRAQGLVG